MKILDQDLYFGKFSCNDRLEITEPQWLKADVRVVEVFYGGLDKKYFHGGVREREEKRSPWVLVDLMSRHDTNNPPVSQENLSTASVAPLSGSWVPKTLATPSTN
jgi:hypothetical protein